MPKDSRYLYKVRILTLLLSLTLEAFIGDVLNNQEKLSLHVPPLTPERQLNLTVTSQHVHIETRTSSTSFVFISFNFFLSFSHIIIYTSSPPISHTLSPASSAHQCINIISYQRNKRYKPSI
jgi:hypothetical protein